MAVQLDFTRTSTLVPSEVANFTATVVGVGSIGSHVAEALAKTGVGKLVLWDADKVESHNLPNQGFYLNDLGMSKVAAVEKRLEEGTGADIEAVPSFFEEGAFGTRLVVSALDSMAARKAVFKAFLLDPAAEVFIDGRMGSRFGKVFIVSKDDQKSVAFYMESLHDDANAWTEPCTARSTIFCAYVIAGVMVATFVNWLLEENYTHQASIDLVNMQMFSSTSRRKG